MSNAYITSDLHLGHKNVSKFRTNFSSAQEHDDSIIDLLKSTLTKRDSIWILGDCAFTLKALMNLQEVSGTKHLVLGNHCTDRELDIGDIYNSGVFTSIHGLVKYKKVWLSHAPIHPEELRGRDCLHGHTHYHNINDSRYFNCCLENTDFKLMTYQEIRLKMDSIK